MQRRSADVSVIVSLDKSRIDFFQGFTLPSIEANQPKEILILDEDLPDSVKRNQGAAKASGKYLFFCDNDTILKTNCLETLATYLDDKPDFAFAYCNFALVNLSVQHRPPMKNKYFVSVPWDPVMLRALNYIDIGSLIRKEEFIQFDESMPCLQEWEMWLRMAKLGKKGLFVSHNLYLSFKTGVQSGSEVPKELGLSLIEEKHPSSEWPFKGIERNA